MLTNPRDVLTAAAIERIARTASDTVAAELKLYENAGLELDYARGDDPVADVFIAITRELSPVAAQVDDDDEELEI